MSRDMTAVQKQALQKQAEAEQAERASELTMIEQVNRRAEHQAEVIDYYNTASVPLPEIAEDEDDQDPFREVRMAIGIDQMTYGVEIRTETYRDENGEIHEIEIPGNARYFDFEEGRRYRIPREMADYLDAKGYIMH